ncbi:porin [Polaromonas sp. LjRoot131]|uniref:porin n=1 Tax=Polaromonas sp. LjRoot131 TaxID=3342262 RepID=UPI003ECE1D8E
MKKKHILIAAISAVSGLTHAQSTVTIYGILDANIGSFKANQLSGAGATATIQSITMSKVDSGAFSGNRWGIRFTEDLGGGLAAVGNLESGFNLDSGSSAQGGLLFGRRAVVGLASTTWGTVTVGRNSTSYNDVAVDYAMMENSIFDPSGNSISTPASTLTTINTLAGQAAFLSHNNSTGLGAQMTWLGFNNRFNNSIKYASPNFAGFTGTFTYGFGEDKTTVQPSSRSTSLALKYVNGPLLISGGYQSEGGAINQVTGAKPALENTLISAAYDFKVVKVGVGYNRGRYKGVTATGGDLAAQNEYSISAAVPVGAFTVAAGYAQSKGNDLGKASGFGLQATYALSKRTTLYAGGVSTKNYDKVAAAARVIAPSSNIARTAIYAVGIRHNF